VRSSFVLAFQALPIGAGDQCAVGTAVPLAAFSRWCVRAFSWILDEGDGHRRRGGRWPRPRNVFMGMVEAPLLVQALTCRGHAAGRALRDDVLRAWPAWPVR
jgi:hypothetical protein